MKPRTDYTVLMLPREIAEHASWIEHRIVPRAEMIRQFKEKAAAEKKRAEKILAAADEEFSVLHYPVRP